MKKLIILIIKQILKIRIFFNDNKKDILNNNFSNKEKLLSNKFKKEDELNNGDKVNFINEETVNYDNLVVSQNSELCPYCGSNNIGGRGYRGNTKRLRCKKCNKNRSINKETNQLIKPKESRSDFWFEDGDKINDFKKVDIVDFKIENIKQIKNSNNAENIKLDKDQQYVYDMIMKGKNVFLTGKAGTGKSIIVKKLINQDQKILIPLAPTGIAAINLDGKGQTLHSFFSIPLDITVDNIHERLENYDIRFKSESKFLFNNCDGIIIDEISMVRSDLFDILDIICKYLSKSKEPFGGKQIVCAGDLYQLPPILKGSDRVAFSHKYKSEFFFGSEIFNKCLFEIIELDKIYRQHDKQFILTLNNIRIGIIDDYDINFINNRVVKTVNDVKNNGGITLTPKKKKAELINSYYLNKIESKLYKSTAKIEGNFPESMYPNDIELNFKVGCQIMIIKNIPDSNIKNGMLGTIIEVEENYDDIGKIIVKMHNGEVSSLEITSRKIFKPKYDMEKQIMDYENIGTFYQFPFKLGRASTIHKSQGLNLEKVNLDLDTGAFEKGQTYVALSRAMSFEGLNLIKPLKKNDIKADKKVSIFMGEVLLNKKEKIIKNAIEQSKEISFMYRKGDGTITRRSIIPENVYYDSFEGFDYLKVEGYCKLRGENRHFNVAKIFELEIVG